MLLPFFGSFSLFSLSFLLFFSLFFRVRSHVLLGFSFFFITFVLMLISVAYMESNFYLLSVYKNSHTLEPFLLKLSTLWGSNEGSLCLWLWLMLFFNVFFISVFELWSQRWFVFLYSFYIFAFADPFLFDSFSYFLGLNGHGLNKILVNVLMVIHPPLLYFAYSSSIYLLGLYQLGHLNFLRQFLRFLWGFLTLGIFLGSWWAYGELGWGGYWFWDPVENVSLLPWFMLGLLLHGELSLFKLLFNVFLCNVSTLLIRGGFVNSVHGFVQGFAELFVLFLFLGSFFYLYILKDLRFVRQRFFFDVTERFSLLSLFVLFFIFLLIGSFFGLQPYYYYVVVLGFLPLFMVMPLTYVHFFFFVFIVVIYINTLFSYEHIVSLSVGDSIVLGDYVLSFSSVNSVVNGDYISHFVRLQLFNSDGLLLAQLFPEIRSYEELYTSRSSIVSNFYVDVQAQIEAYQQDQWKVRVAIRPLQSFIWFSILLLVLSILF